MLTHSFQALKNVLEEGGAQRFRGEKNGIALLFAYVKCIN